MTGKFTTAKDVFGSLKNSANTENALREIDEMFELEE
jgi:hypothetical protein